MKKPFDVNKILIPLDFSETSLLALEHAAKFSSAFNSKLHLLHVYRRSEFDVLPNIGRDSVDQEATRKLVLEELKAHANKFSDTYGIEVDVEMREGSVAREIEEAANEVEASMIVMGTHGVSGFEEFFIGSNAYKVVTASKLPVLTVQKHSKGLNYKNIFLGLDSSTHTRDKVSHVATLAKAFNSEVHICALITEEHEEEKKIFNMKVKQVEEYLEKKGVNYMTDEVHGDDIADMLLKRAKEVNADLIAIMTEQEAATGLFVGPYAQRIVNHSKIPVLSVTPFEVVDKFSQSDLGGDYRPFYI